MGGGIQAVHEANELLLVMTLCRHNGAMEYMLQIRESTIYRIMLAWEVFMKAIFWRSDIKLHEEYLFCSMREAFNKARHGRTDIIIDWVEFKLQQPGHYDLST